MGSFSPDFAFLCEFRGYFYVEEETLYGVGSLMNKTEKSIISQKSNLVQVIDFPVHYRKTAKVVLAI